MLANRRNRGTFRNLLQYTAAVYMADSGFGIETEVVKTDILENPLHVLWRHIASSREIGACLRHMGKGKTASWTDAKFHHRVDSGCLHQTANIVVDAVMNKNLAAFFLEKQKLPGL